MRFVVSSGSERPRRGSQDNKVRIIEETLAPGAKVAKVARRKGVEASEYSNFAGSDFSGRRAAAVFAPVQTCKMNDVDPQASFADVLARLPDHPAKSMTELLPWNWEECQQSGGVA